MNQPSRKACELRSTKLLWACPCWRRPTRGCGQGTSPAATPGAAATVEGRCGTDRARRRLPQPLPGAWNSKPPAQPVGNGGSVKVRSLARWCRASWGLVRNGSFAGVGFAVHAGQCGRDLMVRFRSTDISAIGRIDLRVLVRGPPESKSSFKTQQNRTSHSSSSKTCPHPSSTQPSPTSFGQRQVRWSPPPQTCHTLIRRPWRTIGTFNAVPGGAPVGADANFCNTCGQATRATSDSHGQVQSATPSAGAATHPSAPGYEAKTAARALATSLVVRFVAAGFFINVLSSNSGTGTVMGIAVREWPWEVEAYQSSQWLYFLYWALSPFVVAGTALVVVAVPRWRVDAAGFAMMAGVAGIANHTGLLLEGYSFDPGWLPIIVALEALVGFAVIVWRCGWSRLPEAPNVPPGYRYAALCLAGAALAIAAITFEGFDRFIWLLPFRSIDCGHDVAARCRPVRIPSRTLFFNMIWWWPQPCSIPSMRRRPPLPAPSRG